MIFDRTQEDVSAAIDIRNTKIKKFETLTEQDIKTLERGSFTINTLNRIENKQNTIKMLLNSVGIPIEITNKNWDNTQIFDEIEFNRILQNLNVLIESFCVYKNTPQVPKKSFYFEDINSIEKILFDLEELHTNLLKSFRYSGIVYLGQGLNYGVQG